MIRRAIVIGAAVLAVCLPVVAQDEPAPTADPAVATGSLAFVILDGETEQPMPGRLTFTRVDGETGTLFVNPDADPDDLAVRNNVVYSLSGFGNITVPVGTYDVAASRGLEWSVDGKRITIGDQTWWRATLEREIDTTGWISGDFHLHTLTYSGHGDSNMPERIISIVGEGVEFAVATDHNHHTDYGPTIDHLHAGEELTAITGNEVSVPIGHFNAFPLDPGRSPVASDHADANVLFALLREETNAFGIVPVIQVNHPRWSGIDYFAVGGLDPVSGDAEEESYSANFDTIEILNENTGWGYYEPFVDAPHTAANDHSVLRDWYNLLNRGHRYAAVGNSDSHTVHYAFAGYPRNFVASPTDDPAEIDAADVAAALRRRAVFTTTGPFVEFTVNDTPMGGETHAVNGVVHLQVRVQAASWIACDRVKVVVNGDVVEVIDVPRTGDVLDFVAQRTLSIDRDCWISLLVEGDRPMAPIVTGGGRPVRPLAVTNPVWVTTFEGRAWQSPWERADLIAEHAAYVRSLRGSASERGLFVGAAARHDHPHTADLIRSGLTDIDRHVRLCAARVAERMSDPPADLAIDLSRAFARNPADPYLRIALLRALAAVDPVPITPRLVSFLQKHGSELPHRYTQEIEPLLEGRFVTDWSVLGYFPAPEVGTVAGTDFGPESDPDHGRVHEARNGTEARWRSATADATGFLDLKGLAADPALETFALAFAETWLWVADAQRVPVALGTDDGSRVYLNDAIVYDNPARRGATPMEHVDTWMLQGGWNRVLFKVENGTGSFGLYFRVLDETVKVAPEKGK
ncbi:MAG: CehA/McbA family metallohydrolase [Planctomycetes bacterium]|nr:CehA/McbA family metallohydrolase [Planctomycetota bacterium]